MNQKITDEIKAFNYNCRQKGMSSPQIAILIKEKFNISISRQLLNYYYHAYINSTKKPSTLTLTESELLACTLICFGYTVTQVQLYIKNEMRIELTERQITYYKTKFAAYIHQLETYFYNEIKIKTGQGIALIDIKLSFKYKQILITDKKFNSLVAAVFATELYSSLLSQIKEKGIEADASVIPLIKKQLADLLTK